MDGRVLRGGGLEMEGGAEVSGVLAVEVLGIGIAGAAVGFIAIFHEVIQLNFEFLAEFVTFTLVLIFLICFFI